MNTTPFALPSHAPPRVLIDFKYERAFGFGASIARISRKAITKNPDKYGLAGELLRRFCHSDIPVLSELHGQYNIV